MSADLPPVRIGLSGWNYPSWRTGFYKGVPQRLWLSHIARHFDTVEANGTFYKLATPQTVRRWREETPPDFMFVAKGHRWVTHLKRLTDAHESVPRQRDSLVELGEKLGIVLWQLPQSMQRNDERLGRLIIALQQWSAPRHVIEFRHESWFCEPVAAALRRARIANCLSDAANWPMWDAVTTDLVYVRLHGHARTYASRYSTASLRKWAQRIGGWRKSGCAVYVYFDNDAEGHAPYDALRLKSLLSKK